MGKEEEFGLAISEHMDGLKLHYDAARQTRFQRQRTGLGGSADSHYSSADLYKMQQLSREMDRNAMLPIGPWFNTAVNNTIGTGFRLVPQTGDPELNQEILEHWNGWANDSERCDITGENSWGKMERLVAREIDAVGDIFINPLKSGHLELIEAERAISPAGQGDVQGRRSLEGWHAGVERNSRGRPTAYSFARQTPTGPGALSGDLVNPIPARTRQGNLNIFHVYDAKRVSQARGIPALAAAMMAAGMTEDLTFSQLVKNQVSAFVALFITRDSSLPLGPNEEVILDGSNTETLESMTPGMIVRGNKGETMNGFSPAMPNAEWFPYWRQLVRILGQHLGLALEQMLFDTENTTFHGYRGALLEAHKHTRSRQGEIRTRMHEPTYKWRLRNFIIPKIKDKITAEILESGKLFNHKWILPAREYVDPTKDVAADRLERRSGAESPRGSVGKRGRAWSDVVDETVEDNVLAIRRASVAAQELAAEGIDVDWREVLNWDQATFRIPGMEDEEEPLDGNEDDKSTK